MNGTMHNNSKRHVTTQHIGEDVYLVSISNEEFVLNMYKEC